MRVCAKAVILEGLYRQRFKQANVSHEYQRCRTFYKDHVKRYGDIDLDELERRAFARAAAREPAAAGPLPPSFLNAPPLPLIGPYQMVDVRSSAPPLLRSLRRSFIVAPAHTSLTRRTRALMLIRIRILIFMLC